MFDSKKVYPAMKAWLDELARAYLGFLREEHDRLLTENRALTGNTAYLVGGQIFGPGGVRPPRLRGGLAPLPSQLMDAHLSWVAGMERHQTEWQKATQALQLAVSRCTSWQDFRDMLPDHVLRPFPATGLMELERTRPDLYAGAPQEPEYVENRRQRELYWEPKLLDLYEQAAPTIDLYVSYRLL